jgi:hypothetical protein
MKIDQKILDRFNILIEDGKELVKTPQKVPQFVDKRFGEVYVPISIQAAKLESDGCFLLKQVFGENSDYYQRFKAVFASVTVKNFEVCLGLIQSAKEVYEQGYLFDLHQRITADVFDDFLERAVYLLESGDYQAAAVITGIVLEDALRKMCDREGIIFPDKPKPTINTYNTELYKKTVYDKLTFKQVDVLGTLRNHAAHGEWGKFEKSHVEKMIPDVRDFMTKYFV